VGVGGGPCVLVGAAVGRASGTGKFWQAAIAKVMPSQASFLVKFILSLRQMRIGNP
jgi:hypothetical protein